MSKARLGLLRTARLTRRQLLFFALVSTILNGLVTATVGGWLARTYSDYQSRKESVQQIAYLIYERRTRAGMVASALRREADIDEIRYRKRAYDETFVTWNTKIWESIFAIREAVRQLDLSGLEGEFQDKLVAAMSDVDRCITTAVDARTRGQDPRPILDACRVSGTQQFVLDCGGAISNELFKLTKLSFSPFSDTDASRLLAEERVAKACTRPPTAMPGPVPPPSPGPGSTLPTQPPEASTANPAGNTAQPAPGGGPQSDAPEPDPSPGPSP